MDNTFTVIKDGQEIELMIKNPSLKEKEEAEAIKIRWWNKAVKEGCVFAENLNKVLEDQGIWNTEKQTKLDELRLELSNIFDKLDKGGIKLSEAKSLAIHARQIRNEISFLTFDRIRYISNTVEGISSDKEFQYLVSAMVYNKDGKKYFKNFEDYLNRAGDLDAYQVSAKVSEYLYGGGADQYPENKFLKEYGFCDDKLRLVNKDGNLVDIENKLIDEDGNYIKFGPDGQKIILDENGEPVAEQNNTRKPFLNEDDKPIILEKNSETNKKDVME